MQTPGRRHPAQWLVIAASLAAAGCVSQPSALVLEPSLRPVNARLVRLAPSAADEGARVAPRGEISLAESAHYVYVEQLLMARAPGLDISSLGQGRFTMLVRGRSALTDRREPLVVIDGMQFSEHGAEMLAAMSPRDVRKVEVLRDAASTAYYGTRGANGVVVVTSRRAVD
ncbi:MAG: TonB-dependent receptor plug domain-containing protein [Gemmatimonadaceae bacterium]